MDENKWVGVGGGGGVVVQGGVTSVIGTKHNTRKIHIFRST